MLFFLSIPLRLLAGALAGRFPIQPLLVGGMMSGSLALVGLVVLRGGWVPYLSIAGLAVLEGCSPLNWITLGNFFGRKTFATLLGIMSVFYSPGVLILPVYAGWLFDNTGSYKFALVTFAVLYGTSGILFGMTRRPHPPAEISG